MTDIRDEAALRAMAALIISTRRDMYTPQDLCELAYSYAEAFVQERRHRADKRESDLRASLNHD